MPATYAIVDVRGELAGASVERDEPLGTKEKFWFRRGGVDRWLFKYRRAGTGEDWAERIAAEVATLLRVPHAQVELATFDSERGLPCWRPTVAGSYVPPALFVTWQDRRSRTIFPVGRLVRLVEPAGAYEFAYVQGAIDARAAGFEPFLAFPSLDRIFRSRELPPFFRNRVMRHGRPDYASFVRRLGLAPESAEPEQILARGGGVRATDAVEVFAEPLRIDDDRWQAIFFVRSIRHVHDGEAVALSLSIGQRLFCMLDVQNARTPSAVALRTEDHRLLGFCPDYLASPLAGLLRGGRAAEVTVMAINPGLAPVHYRVLCDLRVTVPHGETPFRSPALSPIAAGAVRLEERGDVPRVA